ncbi:hypothetical protein GA0070608_5258 [Micromonospora peucetia]|uniref:Molecular chaperone GrpE (Heat shock protein) n=2 Tax=Micromonospora peucetia TaxID=47871 RepID=A0A1C6W349_9ACTN|nr:hypothetical protein GA0070608_5258 [Micromonospora peucetia]
MASFDEDPTGPVLRLLRESRSGLTRTQIRQKLQDLGIEVDLKRARWKRIERILLSHDDVQVSGKGAAAVFECKPAKKSQDEAGERPGSDATAPASPQAEAQPPTPVVLASPAENGPAEAVAGEPEVTGWPSDVASTEPEKPEPAVTLCPAAPDSTPVRVGEPVPAAKAASLTERLAEATGEDAARSLGHYLSNPLAVGARLGELTKEQLDALVRELEDDETAALEVLLLALPRSSAVANRAAVPSGQTLTPLLAAAAAEVQAYVEPKPDVVSAAAALLRRVCAAGELSTASIPALVTLASAVAAGCSEDGVRALDDCALALSRLLPSMSRDERCSVDLDRLAPLVTGLPFTPDGGRAALILAVGKVRSKSMLHDEWWTGANLDDLAGCANGILAGVTSRPEVAVRYLHPLVVRELSVVESRGRLTFLLGLPSEFLVGVPGEAVAAAFHRVATTDPVVAIWTGSLMQEQRVRSLRRDAEQAQAAAKIADERAEAAEGRAAAMADRCTQLEETLRAEHRGTASLRSAQDRQIQIDVIRSLVNLAAEVEELAADGTEAEVLIERSRALVMAQALDPIGQAGQKMTFDPTVHEPIVGVPKDGTDVTVIRPGYHWRPPGEDVLIEKALVTT